MYKKIFTLISIALLSLPNLASAQEIKIFGQTGYNGNNGNNGRNGRNTNSIDVFVDGTIQTYDISGENGEDGTDGEYGRNASNCKQPRYPAYNLRGASGGQGGNGGSGGNGGNGGNITIYYEDSSLLKYITVNNSGGKGGRGGRGVQGGDGCSISEQYWQVKYCTWELWQRRRDSENSQWRRSNAKRKLTKCTGKEKVDVNKYTPKFPRVKSNIALRWKYLGVTRNRSYQAIRGSQGESGKNGKNGKNGNYGEIILIPRQRIPAEKITYEDSLSNLIGRKIDLSKNMWVEKRGLRNLLNSASNVPNSYKYLLIGNHSYIVDWQASQTPQQLEVDTVTLGGKIGFNNLTPKISLDLNNLPGTIDYEIKNEKNLTRLVITGGFAPSRVRSFTTVQYGGNKPNQIVIQDNGKVKDLLAKTKIYLNTRITQNNPHPELNPNIDNYDYKDNQVFELLSNQSTTENLNIKNNQYTLTVPLNTRALNDFWFASGANIIYEIRIIQKTKMGKEYSQNIDVNFTVP